MNKIFKNKSFIKTSSYIASLVILFAPMLVFAWTPSERLITCGAVDGSQPECNFNELLNTANNIIDFLLIYFATPLAAIIFAWAGFIYLTSAGNSSKVSKAKSMMKNMLIGYVIALASWIIVNTIMSALGYQGGSFLSLNSRTNNNQDELVLNDEVSSQEPQVYSEVLHVEETDHEPFTSCIAGDENYQFYAASPKKFFFKQNIFFF